MVNFWLFFVQFDGEKWQLARGAFFVKQNVYFTAFTSKKRIQRLFVKLTF